MRLKMHLEKVKNWWKPENATVSILDLIGANVRVKLSSGLIYILSPVEKAMSKIRWGASATRSQAKATIARRTIEQIKPVKFEWSGTPSIGIIAQTIAPLTTNQISAIYGAQGSSYTAGSGLGIGANVPYAPNSIQFNNTNTKPVLTITHDGEVIWDGKPSEAAEALKRTFQFTVEDMKGVTKAARRRYYWRAVDNLARKSEQMTADEFVDFVRKQAYNRECKVLIDTLKGSS